MNDRLTARDVENQSFNRKLRGVDPEEVSLYLRSVAEEIERLHLDNGDLRETLGELKRQIEEHRSRERTLQETMVAAQKHAEETKERSRAEADLLIKEARLKAEAILQQAREQLSRIEADISRCKVERDLFQQRVRGVIEEHLTMLETRRREGDEAGADNVRYLHRRAVAE